MKCMFNHMIWENGRKLEVVPLQIKMSYAMNYLYLKFCFLWSEKINRETLK